jgi:mono/diheme cytochrome c family protein
MVSNKLAVAAVLLSLAFPASVAAQAPTKTVKDGVYTEAQAKRGQAEFEAICATCHRAEWFGGPEFKQHWGYGELFWVYDFIRTNMPYEQGGTLPKQTYIDVLAYILKLNGYPAGTYDLPTTDEGFLAITFPNEP